MNERETRTEEAENRRTAEQQKNNGGAVLLTHDGKMYNVPWHGRGLEELRRLLNCQWVEAVRLRGPLAGLSIWCDEEGKLQDHMVNYPASLLYRYLCGGDYMAGRCVILADDDGGDSVALSGDQVGVVRCVLNYLHMITALRGDRIKATGPRCELVEM